MLFVCYEAICEVESMLCPVFYKSRVGAEGFKNLFPIFVPPTQNPKISKVHNRAGKNESVVCQTNFRAKNQKMRTKRLSFEKSEAFFFSVEGLKRSKSLNEEFVTK